MTRKLQYFAAFFALGILLGAAAPQPAFAQDSGSTSSDQGYVGGDGEATGGDSTGGAASGD